MSKFRLSKEISQIVNDAVNAFASRVESEFKVNKERIIEIWNSCSEDTAKPVKKSAAVKSAITEEKKVQEILKKPGETLRLKKNKQGNYEHQPTGFVFDAQTKEVYGKQNGDTVAPLALQDVEVCKQYHFKYRLPETFQDDVVIDDDLLSDLESEDEEEDEE